MRPCIRTTLDINDRLHARGDGQRATPRLPTYTGAGLQPGVDLTDGAALLEVMDADAGR